MSIINVPIGPQSFEIVRDRIGRILAQELLTQFQLNYDLNLRANVWIERWVPFDLPTEYPSVNIQLAEGNYGGQTQIQSDGTYRYYVDCYVGANTTPANGPGDQFAMAKLQRLMGVVRSIIEYHGYKTLGFKTPPGFIMNRHWEGIQIANPDQKRVDAASSVMGRLVLSVKVPETNDLGSLASPLNVLYTQWMLTETSRGYLWVTNAPSRIFDVSYDNTFN